jgi:hypothetical protein
MKRTFIALVFFVSFALAACSGDIPYLPDEVPEVPTSLELITQPGSTVYLAGTQYGPVPSGGTLLIEGLRPGAHDLRIQSSEHYTYEERISLAEFRRNRIEAPLYSQADYLERVEFGLVRDFIPDREFNARLSLIRDGQTVFECDSEDFVASDPSYAGPVAYGSTPYMQPSSKCVFTNVPRGLYSIQVRADGYLPFDGSFDLTYGHGTEGRYSMMLNRDWRYDVEQLSLAPGDCVHLSGPQVGCSAPTLYLLGEQSSEGPMGTSTRMFAFLAADIEPAESSRRAFYLGPRLVHSDGSRSYSEVGSGPLLPGDRTTLGVTTAYTDSFSEEYVPVLAVAVRENVDEWMYTESILGFNPIISDAYLDAQLAPGECSFELITTRIDAEATNMVDCISALYDLEGIEQLAREECVGRPAYVGTWTMHIGELQMPMVASCEGILVEREPQTFCTGSPFFSCEDATQMTLTSLGRERFELDVANRFGADVLVVRASVYEGIPYLRWNAPEPCASVELDTLLRNGAITTLELEFGICTYPEIRDGWVPQKTHTFIFDLLVDGQPEQAEMTVSSDGWHRS